MVFKIWIDRSTWRRKLSKLDLSEECHNCIERAKQLPERSVMYGSTQELIIKTGDSLSYVSRRECC